MQFKSPLYEATLLRRSLPFMAEVVLENRRKLLLRCPCSAQMAGCDTLGSRVWYSNSPFQEYLQTWELVEVDQGYLVSVNREQIKELVLEGILKEVVTELTGYERYKIDAFIEPERTIDLILEQTDQKCFMNIEHVINCDQKGEAYFPTQVGEGIENLEQLIALKKQGHRAVLFFCVTHMGVFALKPAEQVDMLYAQKLKEAVRCGVEVLVYRTNITLERITLSTRLPFLLSEDQLSLN